jgi:hypothetical protein
MKRLEKPTPVAAMQPQVRASQRTMAKNSGMMGSSSTLVGNRNDE